MNKITNRFILVLLMASLAACAGLDDRYPDQQQGGTNLPLPPVEDRTSNSNATVINSLLRQADQAANEYRWEDAVVLLERGLRIEPRNAILWQRLAQVRYVQSDYHQAIQLAAKSNSFAAGDRQTKQRNQQIMINAYQSLGEYEKAKELQASDRY